MKEVAILEQAAASKYRVFAPDDSDLGLSSKEQRRLQHKKNKAEVQKMKMPSERKKSKTQKNSGRPAPMVVTAPPTTETPTPCTALRAFSYRVPPFPGHHTV